MSCASRASRRWWSSSTATWRACASSPAEPSGSSRISPQDDTESALRPMRREDGGRSVRRVQSTPMPMRAEHATDTDTAFVSTAFELLPMLTVAENVALPVRLSGSAADPAWIAAVLRAVAIRPARLVVEDPAGAVDSVTRQGTLRTLRHIAAELGVVVVIATGDAA